MSRRGSRGAEIAGGDIADIAIPLGLHPGPAIRLVETQSPSSPRSSWVFDAGIGTGLGAQIGDRSGDARRTAINEPLGRHLPCKALVGEVGPEGMQAAVVNGQIGKLHWLPR